MSRTFFSLFSFFTIATILLAISFVAGPSSADAFQDTPEIKEPDAENDDEDTTTKFVETISGEAVAANGTPLADVELKINCQVYGKSGNPKQLKWESKSDSDGKYSIDVVKDKLALNAAFYLSVDYSKDKYISGNFRKWIDGSKRFTGEIEKLVVKRGIKATGRLVPPEGFEGDPIENASLAVGKKRENGRAPNGLFKKTFQCEEDGTFEIFVPEDSELIVVAQSDNFALLRQSINVPAMETDDQVHDLGDISLKSGTKITGVLLDKNGIPRKGILVSIRQGEKRYRDNLGDIAAFAKTDVEGYFELPPRVGKCVVATTPYGEKNGETIKSEGELFPVKPMKFDFDGKEELIEIELVECPVYLVSGTAKWAAEDSNASPTLMLQFDNTGNQQKNIAVESNGDFKFDAMEGVSGRIWVYGSNDDGTGYIQSRLSTETLKQNRDVWGSGAHRTGQSFKFKGFSRDVSNIEFELSWKAFDRNKPGRSIVKEAVTWLLFGNDEE